MQVGRTPSLRVALLASFRFPVVEPFAGGLEAYVWSLARELKRRGHHVTMFAAPGSDAAVADHLHHYPATSGGATPDVDHSRRDISRDPDLVAEEHRAYLSAVEALSGPNGAQFDIVHNNSLHYLPVAMAQRVRAPMISTLHTPPLPMVTLAMRTPARRPSRFVAVSAHTAQSWGSAADHPIDVIHNGVDTTRWCAGPGGGPLVWSGRLVAEKGVELAVAAARAAGRTVDIAGPIIDSDYFERVVVPLLADDVRYLGHLSQHELARVVGRASACLVTPRWDEPYGMVVAEALSCGTPVAAFARGGIPEIVTAACGRLAPAGDVRALTAAVVEACELPRAAARRRAVEHCSVQAMVDAYLEIYAATVAGRRHRRPPSPRSLHPAPAVAPA